MAHGQVRLLRGTALHTLNFIYLVSLCREMFLLIPAVYLFIFIAAESDFNTASNVLNHYPAAAVGHLGCFPSLINVLSRCEELSEVGLGVDLLGCMFRAP